MKENTSSEINQGVGVESAGSQSVVRVRRNKGSKKRLRLTSVSSHGRENATAQVKKAQGTFGGQ